jgi:hypothetical protein
VQARELADPAPRGRIDAERIADQLHWYDDLVVERAEQPVARRLGPTRAVRQP